MSAGPSVPPARHRYASLGAVPMPPERPFTLGEPQAEPPPEGRAVDQRRAARDPGPVSTAVLEESDFSPRGWWQPRERMTPQASAYAPAPRLDPSHSVMSGRGLY